MVAFKPICKFPKPVFKMFTVPILWYFLLLTSYYKLFTFEKLGLLSAY
jgi:hypothetical protein